MYNNCLNKVPRADELVIVPKTLSVQKEKPQKHEEVAALMEAETGRTSLLSLDLRDQKTRLCSRHFQFFLEVHNEK